MEDAKYIHTPGDIRRVFAYDINEDEKCKDFFCPECHLPVQFIPRGGRRGETPHFKHGRVKDRKAAECSCSRYHYVEKRSWTPMDSYNKTGGIPLYLTGKKEHFKLIAVFPSISSETLNKLIELNVVVYVIPNSSYSLNNNIPLELRNRAVNNSISCEIEGAFLKGYKIELRDKTNKILNMLPQEVINKWKCGISGLRDGNIFHSWNEGGMRVANSGYVYVGKRYRLLRKNDGIDIVDGIEFKKAGTIDLNEGHRFKSWVVWDFRVVDATQKADLFLRECGYFLANTTASLIPLWPPGAWQGRELISDNEITYFAFKYGSDNKDNPKIYTGESNGADDVITINKINDKYGIAQITAGISKLVMVNSRLTPMCFEIRRDKQIFDVNTIKGKIIVTDKNNINILSLKNTLPASGILYVNSNVPIYSRIEKGLYFVVTSFRSDKLEGVRWNTSIVIDAGQWGEWKFDFFKNPTAISNTSLYRLDKQFTQLMICSGPTIPLKSRIIRLIHMIESNKNKNLIPINRVLKRWMVKGLIPISALPILINLEKQFAEVDELG